MPPEQRPSTVLIIKDEADAWIERKAALEQGGFRVVEVKNQDDALLSLRDANSGVNLLITSPDFSVQQLQVAAQVVEQYGLPVIMLAGAAYPIGIQDKFAMLLEPVSNAELISTARALTSQRFSK